MFDNNGLMGGLVTGAVLFIGDMLLKPRLGSGLGEIFRFLLEGAACEMTYHSVSKSRVPCKPMQNVSLMGSGVAAITIWATDIFIRPEMFGGLGTEFIKFFLQGFIVFYVIGFVDTK